MNHTSFEANPTSYSKSDRRRSAGISNLLDSIAGMNRDPSQNDSDDGAKHDKQAMVPLHKDFFPGHHDVICGRGKKCYAHTGNERFRQIVQSHLDQYSAASSRPEKSEILSSIVTQVRTQSPDGGFVKQDTATGTWYEVGDFLAREKTSQAFRDALHEHYRSSKKSKHEKRRQRTQAKALIDKESSEEPPAMDQGDERHQLLYPSPLVSRQQLTVLREEVANPPVHHAHPRAYSFSGQTHEPRVREVASRAMSLSSGQNAGRVGERVDLEFSSDHYDLPYREPYHRTESASDRFFGQQYSADDLGQPEKRVRDQMEAGHESWPQPYRHSSRSVFAPPLAPQFHPVQAEDVAAHRMLPIDSDATMAEVEGGRFRRGSGSTRQSRSRRSQLAGDKGSQRPRPRGETNESPSRNCFGPTPLSVCSGTPNPPSVSQGRYALAQASLDAAARHQRADSTSSATVIVAQLTSALQPESLAPDENPFEPIPLPGRSKKKPKTERSNSGW